jgi:hypothetical protein
MSFVDTSNEEGFTIRIHAHSRSPLRSDVIASGHGLDVSSVLESIPRLVSRPPLGYAETALGVYRKPERDEAARVGTLSEGVEVLAGRCDRQGRWMHISAPVDGWIQACTRDGRDLLEEVQGEPNLRQVVSIRARKPADIDVAATAKPAVINGQKDQQQASPRAAELAHFKKSAAFSEASRLDREASSLEANSLLGIRSRKALVGVLTLRVP